ncbi:hypothetical protein K461DRAFT_72960 [Myriangium duriaei CBS 260.36]|uniref:Uncharacterized protein n=1 Tax=Myriangium duriaei CBS 260.36 TaxID=1168546 RepID=A0A9P4IU16_9PEZI|nr:hypothetical protein K461DRAFT_72960 [Myriangium duriaei CBS 260.36]
MQRSMQKQADAGADKDACGEPGSKDQWWKVAAGRAGGEGRELLVRRRTGGWVGKRFSFFVVVLSLFAVVSSFFRWRCFCGTSEHERWGECAGLGLGLGGLRGRWLAGEGGRACERLFVSFFALEKGVCASADGGWRMRARMACAREGRETGKEELVGVVRVVIG